MAHAHSMTEATDRKGGEITPAQLRAARRALIRWYDAHKRDLPWRRSRDPYAIWVSEIMLQQTRVDTVIPYYTRFLERFPTPEALADASEDDVMSAWSGLGYYRRARLLHKGVREVVASYGGRVPEDADARLGLPGIGRYTAGAIGSIAFERPEPIVDGNVARVLCRFLGIETELGKKETEAVLWEKAALLAKGERPGDLNQALMELGALVCTPSQPSCDACPWRKGCFARREGATDRLPVPRVRKAPKKLRIAALIAEGGKGAQRGVWLVRGEGALFGGLWSPPMVELTSPSQDGSQDGTRAASELAKSYGLRSDEPPVACGAIRHVLSHRDLQIEVFAMPAARGRRSATRQRVSATELSERGISALTRKVLDKARG